MPVTEGENCREVVRLVLCGICNVSYLMGDKHQDTYQQVVMPCYRRSLPWQWSEMPVSRAGFAGAGVVGVVVWGGVGWLATFDFMDTLCDCKLVRAGQVVTDYL